MFGLLVTLVMTREQSVTQKKVVVDWAVIPVMTCVPGMTPVMTLPYPPPHHPLADHQHVHQKCCHDVAGFHLVLCVQEMVYA